MEEMNRDIASTGGFFLVFTAAEETLLLDCRHAKPAGGVDGEVTAGAVVREVFSLIPLAIRGHPAFRVIDLDIPTPSLYGAVNPPIYPSNRHVDGGFVRGHISATRLNETCLRRAVLVCWV